MINVICTLIFASLEQPQLELIVFGLIILAITASKPIQVLLCGLPFSTGPHKVAGLKVQILLQIINFICPFPAKMKDRILKSIFERFKGLKPGVIELGLRDSMPVLTSTFCGFRGRWRPGAVE